MRRPVLVVHADWSVHPGKRWMARAVRRPGGGYLALPPAPVAALEDFWLRLGQGGGSGPILVGFDFPIGLPAAYAARAGIEDFATALAGFGEGRWRDFYEVAWEPEQIALTRPFYPNRPGGRTRRQLLDGLGLENWQGLHRRCDRGTASRPAACPMFWTLGGNQVGKAMIVGWRQLLAPAHRTGVDVAIWPFDGTLADLLRRHRFVVAEAYPGEVYGHLGLSLRACGGKRSQAARSVSAPLLLDWAGRANVVLAPELCAEIAAGFGGAPGADDRFDAVVGLFGLLDVVRGARPSGEPDDPVVRRIEGWILGQDGASPRAASGGARPARYACGTALTHPVRTGRHPRADRVMDSSCPSCLNWISPPSRRACGRGARSSCA